MALSAARYQSTAEGETYCAKYDRTWPVENGAVPEEGAVDGRPREHSEGNEAVAEAHTYAAGIIVRDEGRLKGRGTYPSSSVRCDSTESTLGTRAMSA